MKHVVLNSVDDVVETRCPYCGDPIEFYLEAELEGAMVQDCEVCCRPLDLVVHHDEDGTVRVTVQRAQ